jgi:hypothetical protein
LLFLSYGVINLTPSVTFFLGFDAISHSYPIITKGPIFYKITIIPLFLCTTHIHHRKHTLFSLKSSIYISNYLNVTRRTRNRALTAHRRRVNERMRSMHRELDIEFAAVSERGFRTPVANIARVTAILERNNDPNVRQVLRYA